LKWFSDMSIRRFTLEIKRGMKILERNRGLIISHTQFKIFSRNSREPFTEPRVPWNAVWKSLQHQ
jgi:hypothetical protein